MKRSIYTIPHTHERQEECLLRISLLIQSINNCVQGLSINRKVFLPSRTSVVPRVWRNLPSQDDGLLSYTLDPGGQVAAHFFKGPCRDFGVVNEELLVCIDVNVGTKHILGDVGEILGSVKKLATVVVGRAGVGAIVCVVVLLEECCNRDLLDSCLESGFILV